MREPDSSFTAATPCASRLRNTLHHTATPPRASRAVVCATATHTATATHIPRGPSAPLATTLQRTLQLHRASRAVRLRPSPPHCNTHTHTHTHTHTGNCNARLRDAQRYHPNGRLTRPLIDYDASLLFCPALLAGTMFGSMFSVMFPEVSHA